MAIYDNDGNALSVCYDNEGNALSHAYDLEGNVVWDATPVTMRFTTYNVGDWYIGSHTLVPTDKKTAYETLQRTIFENVNADICCMQEAPPKFCQDDTLASTILDDFFDHLETCAAYTSSFIPYRTYGSNIQMEDFQMIFYSSAGQEGTTKTFEKFYVTVGGRRICVIGTHLSLTKSVAIQQASELISAVSGEQYYIICGDFNTAIHADEPDYTELTDYQTIVKPFLDAGMNSANLADFGAFYTYGSVSYESYLQGNGYMSATDHIFTSQNITIDDVFVDTTKLNDTIADKVDHIPLVADLTVN